MHILFLQQIQTNNLNAYLLNEIWFFVSVVNREYIRVWRPKMSDSSDQRRGV